MLLHVIYYIHNDRKPILTWKCLTENCNFVEFVL